MSIQKVVLITGAAKRVGAVVARKLHAQGMNIAVHYRSSANDAQALCAALNQERAHSAIALPADLNDTSHLPKLVDATVAEFGRLDVLINNASSFYPTPIGKATEQNWNDLIGSNVKAPFFLAQAAAPHLTKTNGCIINMVDIHAQQPLKNFTVYCIAKAGLVMLTKSLAKELGPHIRVNAIAPGPVLWPDNDPEFDKSLHEKVISRTALKRSGSPDDIANTALFLIQYANYVTGQIIAVDGGRSLNF